jgi:hypothetical protein
MRKSEDRAHLCPHFMAVKCHLRTYGRYLPRVGPKRETIVSLRLGFMVFRSIQFGFKKACRRVGLAPRWHILPRERHD